MQKNDKRGSRVGAMSGFIPGGKRGDKIPEILTRALWKRSWPPLVPANSFARLQGFSNPRVAVTNRSYETIYLKETNYFGWVTANSCLGNTKINHRTETGWVCIYLLCSQYVSLLHTITYLTICTPNSLSERDAI